jgi:uncharacterized cupin superfamily protein
VKEARLRQGEHGLVPEGEGWFVVNARETRWGSTEQMGRYVAFEPVEARFAEVGINIHVIEPGQPNSMYHAEDTQEGFLVLSGECLLIVEGEELRLRPWDFFHCPGGTAHVLVGAGEGPCAILMVGARTPDDRIVYPANETARRHGAAVDVETSSPAEAYAHVDRPVDARYRDGDLPER